MRFGPQRGKAECEGEVLRRAVCGSRCADGMGRARHGKCAFGASTCGVVRGWGLLCTVGASLCVRFGPQRGKAGAYRGPDGERIEVAKAATFTRVLSVDSPHRSSGAGSVIVKPRVACKGPSTTIPIRVIGYLAKSSKESIPSLRIVAESDYTQ